VVSHADLHARLQAADPNAGPLDFAGCNLANTRLERVALCHANLERADLRGARLGQVDLTGANLRGALLDESHLQMVDLGGAELRGAQARGCFWKGVNLEDAGLEGINLHGGRLHSAMAQRARFDGADLARSQLVYGNFADASLRGSDLLWANTVGSYFRGVHLEGARRFFLSRELIVEVLMRGLRDGEQEAHAFVGAILTDRDACYPEWKARLASEPRWMERALEIFAAFPESGFSRALETGWQPPPSARRDEHIRV
jgi:uncharacterized protein YjbI with pentapeptide repeats